MKVAQEIDVDNVTIIINPDNKLQAVLLKPIDEEFATFNLVHPQFDSRYKLEWVDDVYQVEGTDKFIKGTKLNKVTELSWKVHNLISNFNSNRTWKELRDVEEEPRFYHSGKEYEVKTVTTYNITLMLANEKGYDEDDLNNFINSVTRVVEYKTVNNIYDAGGILYALNPLLDIKTVKHSTYVEVTVTETATVFVENSLVEEVERYLVIEDPSVFSLKPYINGVELRTKEMYLGKFVYLYHQG